MSSEFRSVHAAQEALAKYTASGKNLGIIRQIDMTSIARYDVWLCVFEKEPEASAILMEKELYSMLLKQKDDGHEVTKNMIADFCILWCLRVIENPQSYLSLSRVLDIALDVKGKEFIPYLKSSAKWSLNTRRKIVKPYVDQDTAWVDFAQTVLDEIESR